MSNEDMSPKPGDIVHVEAVPQQHIGQVNEAAAMVSLVERMMKDPSVDVDKLERLMLMRERVREQENITQFNIALSQAQGEMDPVRKDCDNPQTKSRYASYVALDQAIRPIYTKHGFTVSFDTVPSEARNELELMVVMYLSHGGYTRRYQIPIPCDGKGARGGEVMSRTHATGSGFTYGRRYLLAGAFNITTGDTPLGRTDDDGNAAPGRRAPAPAQNAMRAPSGLSQPTGGPGKINPELNVVSTNRWKELDHNLSEAAKHGTAFLQTAWLNLNNTEKKAMKAALDRRYKPTAEEADQHHGEADGEEDESQSNQDYDDQIPF